MYIKMSQYLDQTGGYSSDWFEVPRELAIYLDLYYNRDGCTRKAPEASTMYTPGTNVTIMVGGARPE